MRTTSSVGNPKIFRNSQTAATAYVKKTYAFLRDNPINLWASGIAFNVLLCIVPALLCLLYILGIWLERDSALDTISIQLQTFIPDLAYREMIMNILHKQMEIIVRTKRIAGFTGIVGSFWAGSVLFASARTALNMIYGFPHSRSFFIQRVKDLIMVVAFGMLALTAAGFAPLSSIIVHNDHVVISPIFYRLMSGLAPIMISTMTSFILFVLLYRFLANKTAPFISTIAGAGTATVLWEVAKALFDIYLARFASFGIVYGTYAFIVATALWIYFSALIFILGGIVTSIHWRRSRHWKPAEGFKTRTPLFRGRSRSNYFHNYIVFAGLAAFLVVLSAPVLGAFAVFAAPVFGAFVVFAAPVFGALSVFAVFMAGVFPALAVFAAGAFLSIFIPFMFLSGVAVPDAPVCAKLAIEESAKTATRAMSNLRI